MAFLLVICSWQARAYRLVPDTLDLEKRANLAFNALVGTTDERGEFMFRCGIVPPFLKHDAYSFAACGPKYMESLAMMSAMTGIDLKKSAAKKPTDYLLSCLGSDGLFYCKIGPDRPWDKTSPEDWANMYGQGRMIRAMLAMYQMDKDPVWIKRMKKLVHTLEKIAIRKTDAQTGETYAYYPTTPGYGDIFSYPKSGWKTTELLTSAQESMADLPDHSFGIPLYIGGMIEPLTRYAKTFNDKDALELAGQLVRFVMKKESAWMPDGHPQGIIPEQNGQFYGHFHAHTLCLRGILEYGIATNDTRLKNFARAGYEYARTFGITRIGWFEEYTGKFSHETCGLANMTALAIKLSLSGVGDYWDDVDCYVRNQLTQAQFTDMKAFMVANKSALSKEQIDVLKRLVGTFAGWGTPNHLDDTAIMNCCTANGSQALYYVWDSIVREQNGAVSINLLLNRKSPWLDVESFLPYRGEVDINIKKSQRISVRIPNWVDKSAIKISINGKTTEPVWIGNYLCIGSMPSGVKIKVCFPMSETVERYAVDSYEFRGTKYLGRYTYTISFRGNTAIGIEPKASDGYPIYTGTYSFNHDAPRTSVSDYVGIKRIAW